MYLLEYQILNLKWSNPPSNRLFSGELFKKIEKDGLSYLGSVKLGNLDMEVIQEQKEMEDPLALENSKIEENDDQSFQTHKQFALILSLDCFIFELSKSKNREFKLEALNFFMASVSSKFDLIILTNKFFSLVWDDTSVVGPLLTQNFKLIDVDCNLNYLKTVVDKYLLENCLFILDEYYFSIISIQSIHFVILQINLLIPYEFLSKLARKIITKTLENKTQLDELSNEIKIATEKN